MPRRHCRLSGTDIWPTGQCHGYRERTTITSRNWPIYSSNFRGHEGRLDCWISSLSSRSSQPRRLAWPQHRPSPARSHGRAPCRKILGAPFEPADSMCSEVPSVNQRRHTHRDGEPRRPPPRVAPRIAVLAVLKDDTRSHNLFEEGFEEDRSRAVPQWRDDDEMPRRKRWLLVPRRGFRGVDALEIFLCA
jgi:hypothetical protein